MNALVAAYVASCGRITTPAYEETLTMCPRPRASIPGSAWRESSAAARHVETDDEIERVGVHLGEAPDAFVACVVDEDVDRTVGLDPIHQPAKLAAIGQVRDVGAAAELARERPELCCAAGQQRHIGAGRREPAGELAPDPATG